jgi:UPF0176 protein
MSAIINLSAYRFAPLEDLPSLKERLKAVTATGGLKGTILLSQEGINLFVAGHRTGLDQLLAEIHTVPGLGGLEPKESRSARQPFNRMLVKIKKEIIAFGVPGIDPARRPAPKLPARTLKQWLDDGRPITLLDTRNDYEVNAGTFRGALTAGIRHFRDFPKVVDGLPEKLKELPIVMFCTGGIRCEKAGPFMEQAGFKHVFQLEGGILKYFEECGGAHFKGECFVFDGRVGVDASLQETSSVMCFACRMPLSPDDQQHPHYVPEKSCPRCFNDQSQPAALATRMSPVRTSG